MVHRARMFGWTWGCLDCQGSDAWADRLGHPTLVPPKCRERTSKAYHVSPYYLARFLCDLPLRLAQSLLFGECHGQAGLVMSQILCSKHNCACMLGKLTVPPTPSNLLAGVIV